MGTVLLENAACLSKMYGHDVSQALTKMRELVVFVGDQHHLCLIIKQKAGWLLGMQMGHGPMRCIPVNRASFLQTGSISR